jgi:hypothetical protein
MTEEEDFKVEFAYVELAFIRDIIREKRHDIWLEQYGSRLDKNLSIDERAKLREELFARHIFPITDIGCCCSILLKIDDYEKRIERGLKGNEN